MSEQNYAADWRCESVIRLPQHVAKLPGRAGPIPAGATGKAIALIDYRGSRFAFPLPNATALFLNLSHRHFEAAEAAVHRFSSPPVRTLGDDDTFAYLEDVMASVVFAYTALEAFATAEIPDDYVHRIDMRKCT